MLGCEEGSVVVRRIGGGVGWPVGWGDGAVLVVGAILG